MKIICWRFRIKTSFPFWDMRTWDMWKVCLQTFRNNRTCYKLAYFLWKLQTSQANNLRILWIQNAKFSGYCFCMNRNIYRDFQICISVPLISLGSCQFLLELWQFPFIKNLTKNREIKNTLVSTLSNFWRVGQVRDNKFGKGVSNVMIFEAPNC